MTAAFLDRRTGVGLVLANMIGTGVFLSAGFMAQDLTPGEILVSWVLGAVGTLFGVVAYGELAARIGKSGGEYRFLSDTIHPVLGYLSGWASLLVGFSASIAVEALAVGAFLGKVTPLAPPPVITGTVVLIALTALHSTRNHVSRRSQNALVGVKIALVLGFVVVGLGLGSWAWPTWSPPSRAAEGLAVATFLGHQYWITFAMSGWNAAIYAAEEFTDPKRDVPWAMFVGAGLVAALYFVVNWVFVANLTPETAAAVFSHDETKITLGHLVMEDLLGPMGGILMSLGMVVVFTSAMSAMTLVGPRVYSTMARDGFLPRAMIASEGRPPSLSIVLQSGVALALLWSHSLLEAVQSVGAVLMIFGGLTALSVVWLEGARPVARVCGALYAAWMAALLFVGVTASSKLLLTVSVVLGIGLVGYVASTVGRGR